MLQMMFEPNSALSLADQEEHRRTYWSIYLLDSLAACGRGRPPILQDYTCKLLLPCSEEAFRSSLSEPRLSLDQLALSENLGVHAVGYLARVVILASTLSRVANYILQQYDVTSQRPPWDHTSDFTVLRSRLTWLEVQLDFDTPIKDAITKQYETTGSWDSSSFESLVFSYALYHLCHCMLQHHFLLRRRFDGCSAKVPTTFLSDAIKTCWKHAQAMTYLLEDAKEVGCTVTASFYGYCTLMAGQINCLHQYSDDKDVQTKSTRALELNKVFLAKHARRWKNAAYMVVSIFSSNMEKY